METARLIERLHCAAQTAAAAAQRKNRLRPPPPEFLHVLAYSWPL
jgi:hypothetical protein